MISRDMVGGFYAVKPLGKVVEFLDSRRKPVKESERSLGAYPYYGANGQQGTINNYIFDEPLVLLAEDGGFFDQPDRGVAYRISGKTWVNNHAHVLRPKQGLDINYLCRVLENYDLTPYVTGTTRGKLTKSGASEILIPLPPIAQQKRIAAILDKAEELRGLRRKALGELDAIVQSIFLEMFGDPVTNPMGWKIMTIGELAKVETGGTPDRAKPDFYAGSIPWVKTGEVMNNIISSTEERLTQAGLSNSNCRLFPVNTIIVAMYGQGLTRGRSAKLGIQATTNQACAAILPNSKFDADYLWLLIQLSYQKMRELGRGGNQPNLNLNLVKSFKIILPPLPFQQEFARRVEAIEQLKATHRESLAHLDALFASLQHRAFRGEL